MNLKTSAPVLVAVIVLYSCFYLLTGCGAQENKTQSETTTSTSFVSTATNTSTTNDQTVKSIELPHDEADFPPGKGRDLFIARCNVCHSLRYVTMQPDFPEATWAKEVDKMIKTFGAHISEPEAKEIIEYLTAIKGKPAQKH